MVARIPHPLRGTVSYKIILPSSLLDMFLIDIYNVLQLYTRMGLILNSVYHIKQKEHPVSTELGLKVSATKN